jgi:hypothetical protein
LNSLSIDQAAEQNVLLCENLISLGWRQPWANDSFIRLQRLRISYKAVGVGAAEGVTITVAVKPAASVIVGGTLSIFD